MTYSFDPPQPAYLENWIQTNLERVDEELQSIWGFSLQFPVSVKVQRERALGARGEAAFDGNLYHVFLTPIAEEIPSLLRHEWMHLYTFDWMVRNPGHSSLPLWWVEGLAVWFEGRHGIDWNNVLPWQLIRESNLLSIEEYPQGGAFPRYYTLLSDFFAFLERKVNFQEHLPLVLQRLSQGADIFQAFSGFCELQSVFRSWRWRVSLLSLLSFFAFHFFLSVPAVVVFALGLFLLWRRRKIKDSFDPSLERRFGKEYWKKQGEDAHEP